MASIAISSDRIQAIDVTLPARDLYLDHRDENNGQETTPENGEDTQPRITYASRARAGTRDPCERKNPADEFTGNRRRSAGGFNGAWCDL